MSLLSLVDAGNEEDLIDYLQSFKCEKNKDVESFLHTKSINNEKRSFTRTSLVIDEDDDNIIGYFTLVIKPFNLESNVSGSLRKILTSNKKAEVFNSVLIAQLGRADKYRGIISGEQVLKLALENCLLINELSALRIVTVEYDGHPFLNDFYLRNEFKILQHNKNGKVLAFLKLS
ncbi:hypothetical protein LC040_03625 [Bacillus tianshenii]|nr:hypothetical protein LC040_03625 [Bacillus tianshenii]